ncbi:MAG: NADP oxidoreductase, partial [Brevefilum sp.]
NFVGVDAALRRAYIDAESNDENGKIPSSSELAVMTRVRAVHEVVPVDLHIPGCPPDADVIFYALTELAQGRIPDIKDEKLHWH